MVNTVKFILILNVLLLAIHISSFAQANLYAKTIDSVKKSNSDSINIVVQNYYKYRADGKPGRGMTVLFNNHEFVGEGKIEVEAGGITEMYNVNEGIKELEILLPAKVGVSSDTKVKVHIKFDKEKHTEIIDVPAFRHWEVLIYPHSHVDIGYTNTHANVELIHTRNLVNGLELAKKTKDYPEGARYKWNPEVIWPVERYLAKATDKEKQLIFDGIKDGYLPLDAGYVNVNTSLASDEELFEFFRQGREYEKITGKNIETLVQVDIPGMTWGMIPVAAKLGIKYVFSFNNGYDRVGWSTVHNFKPFWWTDAEGKNKLLYLQPGSYNPGALIKGKYYWPKMAGQTDPDKLIDIVKTDNPRENFIDNYINEKLPELEDSDYYPYKIFPMSWAMADNTPIDADLPDAVKSWNEEFAYPSLKIVSATEIMREFDERYGDQIPVYKGDFTEFWTDGGAGTAAKQCAQNRSSKERLVQAETLWTMIKKGEPSPREEFDRAWWNILMGSEHTWCYMDPHQEPINSDILKSKFDFFNSAEKQSLDLLSKSLPAKGDKYIAVFNNLSWRRSGIVTVSAETANAYKGVVDANGLKVKSQKLSSGELVFEAIDVPAFGSKRYELSKKEYSSQIEMIKGNIMDNGIIRVEIDSETGDVRSLKLGKEEFVDSKSQCAINSYRYLKADDSPDQAFEARGARIHIKENGSLLATLSIITNAVGCYSLTTEITIYDGQANVDFKNIVDKIPTKDKEGIHFGFAFNIDNPKIVADIPWGMMEIEKEQLPGSNRNWIALQRWLDVSNDNKGITLCPLDAPVFQVGTMTANILGAATESDQWIKKLEPSGTIYSWAMNNHWHTNFQLSQGGEIVFRYRVQPHLSGVDYVAANRYGMEQHQPLLPASVAEFFEAKRLLSLDGSIAIFSTIFKTSEDGKSAILRLRSLSNKDETVTLNWHARTPKLIEIFDIADEKSIQKIANKVTVPAMDFVTLKVIW